MTVSKLFALHTNAKRKSTAKLFELHANATNIIIMISGTPASIWHQVIFAEMK